VASSKLSASAASSVKVRVSLRLPCSNETWLLLSLLDNLLEANPEFLTIYLRCVLSFLAGWLSAWDEVSGGWVEWVLFQWD
jgi:hypothetical protein